MPSNSSGWFWHCLARETGRCGHLFSPGAQRGPWPWFPYAMDNGCYSLWNPEENTFDEEKWIQSGEAAWNRLMFWAQCNIQQPLWLIVPDRPGNGEETLEKWDKYAPKACLTGVAKLAIAVQDGMTPEMVRELYVKPDVICVGGSTEWKWATVEMWAKEFKRVHVLRCNSPEKLEYLERLGVESTDGTGWNRGDERQTKGLETFLRGLQCKTSHPLWPHVCKNTHKGKSHYAGLKQETFA